MMTDVRRSLTITPRITGTDKLLRNIYIRLISHQVDELIFPVTEAYFELLGSSSRVEEDIRAIVLLEQKQMIMTYQLKLPVANDGFRL
jgi:hypothetical protein